MLRDSELMFKTFLLAIAQVVPMLPDLHILSVNKALTAQMHCPDLQQACETHKVEILVRSVNSYGSAVVSTHQRFRLVYDDCHSLINVISIHIT